MDFSPMCSTLFLYSKTYVASCSGNLIVKSESLLGHLLVVPSMYVGGSRQLRWECVLFFFQHDLYMLIGCRWWWCSPRGPPLWKVSDLLFSYSLWIGKIGVEFRPPIVMKRVASCFTCDLKIICSILTLTVTGQCLLTPGSFHPLYSLSVMA